MKPDTLATLATAYADPPDLNPWQWADESVDYSRSPSYDTEWKGPYTSSYMPYWREPVESAVAPDVREVWVLKCSRAGGSENMLLNLLRHRVAIDPGPTLYMGGSVETVERFMHERIIRGFALSDQTERALAAARVTEHFIHFTNMDVGIGWASSAMFAKQSGFSLILADEVSTWPGLFADMLRERMAAYAFPHLVGISSPDPAQRRSSDEDPIVIEYGQTDQRKWFCKVGRGRPFVFRMGDPESVDGLKWDQRAKKPDGHWDLDRVAMTAHYVTPDGQKIRERDRLRVVRRGKWVATSTTGIPGRRGYHVTRFMVPFKSCSFGAIARAFLTAKHKGMAPGQVNTEALRTWVYEYMAERWVTSRDAPEENEISKRALPYKRGTRHSEAEPYKAAYIAKQKAVIAGVDVQKDHLWMVAREWIDGGDSGLLDWKPLLTWEDVDQAVADMGVEYMGIDYGYSFREMEVLDYCLTRITGSQWAVPLKGQDRQNASLIYSRRDPYLGKTRGGECSIDSYTWHTDTFRRHLLQMFRGESARRWSVYSGIELEYARQVCAMECVDGKWQTRRGHSQEHMFDCECMGVVMARIVGLYQNDAWRVSE